MQKKALIFDLDNTIYSVHSIGHALFQSLFDLIIRDGNHVEQMDKIKDEIMRRPFQLIASEYHFSDDLRQKGTRLLMGHSYEGEIEPYPDYHFTKTLDVDKFLVTTGFKKLQQSKIEGLKIATDFQEVHIVDPSSSNKTKKDVFADIIDRYKYDKAEVLVVGDDLHSEIKAAMDLHLDALLYDRDNLHVAETNIKRIQSFIQLPDFMHTLK